MTVLGTIKDGIPQLGAKDLKSSWFDNQAPVPDVLATNILQQLPKNDDRRGTIRSKLWGNTMAFSKRWRRMG